MIHSSFKHGKNFKIGDYCVIEKDVWVGNNVTIKNFVELRAGTVIGNDVYIDSYVRSSGQNVIGNNVILRFGCTIARLVSIQDGVFIAPNVMTIHDENKGVTIIGENCKIFTGAVIGAGVIIAKDIIVGAQAFVNKNCTEPGIYIGVPARKI
jgi:acetyltransferase-like isoleucine patch superfamily enzyme